MSADDTACMHHACECIAARVEELEARIARAEEALEMCRAPRYDTAAARRILRGEDDTP